MNKKHYFSDSHIFVIVALLLLIPFIAMKFTDEVKWTPIDFITAGVLMLVPGIRLLFAA
jgi:uncharacterized membrane protein YjjP (DUF1212 family)